MWDIILEALSIITTGLVFGYLLRISKKKPLSNQQGWRYIIIGFGLLFMGNIIDITDNFPELNKYIIIGDTAYEAFLEKFIGYLLGFILVFIGFRHWLPIVVKQRQTEDALRVSEKNYRELVDNALLGIYKTNLKGDLLYANQALAAMLEFDSPEEMASEGILARYNNLKDREALFKALKKTGTVDSFEVELLTKTKTIKNMLLSGTLEGDVLSGIILDITNRKKAEKALKESEERHKKFVNSVTDYIYTVKIESGRTVATSHSPGCLAVTGYAPEEYASNPHLWHQMVHEEDRNSVTEQTAKILSGEAVPPFIHRIIHKDASVRWVKNTPVLRYDENENLIAYDGLVSDITELKKLEDQLRHIQKMEAIGTFAGGIAHDFNNILTAVIGYAHILQMKMKEDDPLRHNAEQILTSAERAASLTQSLLAFSRKQIINLTRINLNDTVLRVEKLLLRLIGEDIELRTILIDKGVSIMADPVQIEQVLINLATNARHAMPVGGILTIETDIVKLTSEFIKAHRYGVSGTYALISVTDTGQGMDEKTKERIFDPFFTTKEPGKGTGLGLAIVYGIIKQHNGYINVYSEIGKGTTFKLYFPLITSQSDSSTRKEPATLLRGGTETILLVEDSIDTKAIITDILQEFGYSVLSASDGEEAIKKFERDQEKINLVILDVIMPKKNGKEVYNEIKKIRPDIRAIFTSGYPADIINKNDLFENGLVFIPKPIMPQELLKKVREALDK